MVFSCMRELLEHLRQEFSKHLGRLQKPCIVRAPGRVNLIGEHTDYNNGFVMPAAINHYIYIVAQPRADTTFHIYSMNYNQEVHFPLHAFRRSTQHRWSNYLRGVIQLLRDADYYFSGMDVLVWGDIPQGAGLSSSAALSTAFIYSAATLFDLQCTSLERIQFAQRAENDFAGVRCGIMDQFISYLGQKDHCIFLDCDLLTYEYVLCGHSDYRFVILNTNCHHHLADTFYNQRRSECETGVQLLQKIYPDILSLRHVSSRQFRDSQHQLPDLIAQRCQHVIEENERVVQAHHLLQEGKWHQFGALMNSSHTSLQQLYEVSSHELDAMVDIARRVPGVLGARMMGGGFGGSTINLVHQDALTDLQIAVLKYFPAQTHKNPDMYVVDIVDGVQTLSDSHTDQAPQH